MPLTRPVRGDPVVVEDFGQPVYDWIVGNTPTAWTNAATPLGGGWSNVGGAYPAAGYRKIGDLVFIRGAVTGGTMGQGVFYLPAGFRPTSNIDIPVYSDNGTTIVLSSMQIRSDGLVVAAWGASTRFALNGFVSTV